MVLVAKLKRFEKDSACVSCLFFIVKTLLYNAVEKFSTHHFFCYQIIVLFFVKDVIESNDVVVF